MAGCSANDIGADDVLLAHLQVQNARFCQPFSYTVCLAPFNNSLERRESGFTRRGNCVTRRRGAGGKGSVSSGWRYNVPHVHPGVRDLHRWVPGPRVRRRSGRVSVTRDGVQACNDHGLRPALFPNTPLPRPHPLHSHPPAPQLHYQQRQDHGTKVWQRACHLLACAPLHSVLTPHHYNLLPPADAFATLAPD